MDFCSILHGLQIAEYSHKLLNSFLQSNNILYEIDYLENFDVGSNLFLEYDLIFLDIELGDYNGIEIASKIRTYNRSSIIELTHSGECGLFFNIS